MRLALIFLLAALSAFSQAAPDLLKDFAGRPALGVEDFQRLALAANPTLKEAEALVKASAARARQAGLYPNPIIGYQGEQIRGGLFDGGEQGGFVQQTFPLGGKLALRRNVYQQQRRADEIGVAEQRYRVAGDVEQSFYAALAAQQALDVRKRLLSLAAEAVDTAHKLANVGQADAPDVLQAEVEAEQAQIDYITAERTFLANFYSLAAVAANPDLPVSPLKGDLAHPPAIDVDRVVDQIVRESPLVKRAEQEIVRAQADLKSASRESVPDLEIHAGLQQNFEPINLNPRIAVGLQGFVTAGIDLPIFNRNQGNIAAAQAERERAQAELARVRLLVRQQAELTLQSYLAAHAEAERYKTHLIPRADRAYQLYLAKYEQMASAYPQVLITQRTSFQLQLAYVNALEAEWTNAILLRNYSLGSSLAAVK